MKKALALLLAVCLVFVLCGCGSAKKKEIYEEAGAFLEQGDYYNAAIKYYSIKDYEDAGEKCFKAWHAITGYNTIDVCPINGGQSVIVAIRENGTLYCFPGEYEGRMTVPFINQAYSWTNLVSVAVGEKDVFGLKEDGTVVSTYFDVSDWKDIVWISADPGYSSFYGIKADGTVLSIDHSETVEIPLGEGIVCVTGGSDYTLGLKTDGSLIGVGDNSKGQLNTFGRESIAQIMAWNSDVMYLTRYGKTGLFGGMQSTEELWESITSISNGGKIYYGLRDDGMVKILPVDSDYNKEFAEKVFTMEDVTAIASNWEDFIALTKNGSLNLVSHKGSPIMQSEIASWAGIRQPNIYKSEYTTKPSEGLLQINFIRQCCDAELFVREYSKGKSGESTNSMINRMNNEANQLYYSSVSDFESGASMNGIYTTTRDEILISASASADAQMRQIVFVLPLNTSEADFIQHGTFAGIADTIEKIKEDESNKEDSLVSDLWRIGKIISNLAGVETPQNGFVDVLLDARSSAQQIGVWTYTMQIDNTGTACTIIGEYSGHNDG